MIYLINDENFARILGLASSGEFDAMVVAFPCSTFSASRLFPSDPPGPPPVRSMPNYPDGLPLSELDPRHHRELRETNKLLDRTIQVIVAARSSPKRTTIVLENPAPRNIRGTPQFGEDTIEHAPLFDTTAFKKLNETIPDTSMATFAYCRLGSKYQKYTTLWYTNTRLPLSLISSTLPSTNAITLDMPRSPVADLLMGRGLPLLLPLILLNSTCSLLWR